ncbi:MAG TPA: DUF4132 domain-containing protein [Polyangia bacterium]
MAADTLDQDVKVVVSELRQFHHHRLTEAFRQRSGGDERRLGRALWEGWRRRVVEASREDKFWDAMALSPEAFSTADLLELLRQVDGEETRYGITSERSLLGWHHAFETMVLARLEGDPGTLASLRALARELSPRLRHGVELCLFRHGAIAAKELPGDIVARIASAEDCAGLRGGPVPHDHPLVSPAILAIASEAQWARAVIDASLHPCAETIRGIGLVQRRRYLEHATADERLRLALASRVAPDDLALAVETLVELPAVREQLVAALEAHAKGEQKQQKKSWDDPPRPDPVRAVAIAVVALGRLEAAWPSKLDAFVARTLFASDLMWEASGYDREMKVPPLMVALRRSLARLPPERRESMFDEGSWLKMKLGLLPLVTTAAVAARAVAAIAEGAGDENDRRCVAEAGEIVIEPIAAALGRESKKPGGRGLVEILGWVHTTRAAQALGPLLAADDKAVRSAAITALGTFDAADVVPLLAEPLAARNKVTRLAAAEVLAKHARHAGASELAKQAVASERAAEVKKLLSKIAATAPERSEVPRTAERESRAKLVLEHLRATDGAGWKDHVALGSELLDPFSEWLAEQCRRYLWKGENLAEALAHFGDTSELRAAIRRAVMSLAKPGGMYPKPLLDGYRALAPNSAVALAAELCAAPDCAAHEEVAAWLAQADPGRAVPHIVQALESAKATERSQAVKTLIDARDYDLTAILPLLTHRQSGTRDSAAKIVAEVGGAQCLEALGAALAEETSTPVRNRLAEALLRSQLRALEADTPADDAALAETLAAHARALRLEPPSKAPAAKLAWRSGNAVSPAAFAWLLCALDGQGVQPVLVAVRARLDDAACERWVGAQQEPSIEILALFGSEAQLEDGVRALAPEVNDSYRWELRQQVIRALAARASRTAIAWLARWASHGKNAGLAHDAASTLRRLAEQRGLSDEQLAELALDDFGFDRRGRRTLAAGGQSLTLRLGRDNEVVVEDAPSKKNAVPVEARTELSRLKRELKRLTADQGARVERAMLSERSWPLGGFLALFVEHPVARALGMGLVFRGRLPDPGAWIDFCVTREIECVDLSLDGVDLAARGVVDVGVPHPAALDARERQAWRQILIDHELIPAFRQLDRPLHRASEDLIERLIATEPPFAASFVSHLARRGYQTGASEGSTVTTMVRSFGRRTGVPVDVEIEHTGHGISMADIGPADTLRLVELRFSRAASALALADVPPDVFSEVCEDLRVATRATLPGPG